MSLLNHPHHPCWHVQDEQRTHGPWGAGRQLSPPAAHRLVCCECGVTVARLADESDTDRVERHEKLRRGTARIPA